jgi:2-hydroxy-3-oxopropionate reductase
VHDRAVDALAGAVSAGGTPAASASELAAASDVLLLVLPDSPQIFEVIDEIADELAPGTVVLIISTVSPETPVELGRLLEPLGVQVLDCPISGGPGRAESGDLAVMVGGDEGVFERIRPVLAAIGSRVVHIGPLGHGQIAKLANNLMGGVIIEGIAEGLAFAAKAGADVKRVAEAIGGGSGSSWILREWVPETVFAGDYARRFSLDLMCKDMGIISALADELGVEVPAAEVARAAFERAVAEGFGSDDFSRAIQLHAERAGVRVE